MKLEKDELLLYAKYRNDIDELSLGELKALNDILEKSHNDAILKNLLKQIDQAEDDETLNTLINDYLNDKYKENSFNGMNK